MHWDATSQAAYQRISNNVGRWSGYHPVPAHEPRNFRTWRSEGFASLSQESGCGVTPWVTFVRLTGWLQPGSIRATIYIPAQMKWRTNMQFMWVEATFPVVPEIQVCVRNKNTLFGGIVQNGPNSELLSKVVVKLSISVNVRRKPTKFPKSIQKWIEMASCFLTWVLDRLYSGMVIHQMLVAIFRC